MTWELALNYGAWPLTVIIIAGISIFVFRGPISNLINRTHKISKGGGLEASPINKQLSDVNEPDIDKPPSDNSDLYTAQLEFIKEQMNQLGITPDKEADFLRRELIYSRIYIAFETVDRAIWGSQLRILKALNEARIGLPEEQLKPYYERVAKSNPELFSKYPFSSYMKFLIDASTIKKKENQYSITPFGIEYLLFITQHGRTFNRGN